MLIGVIVSGVLHGICLVQAFFYFMSAFSHFDALRTLQCETLPFVIGQPKDPLLIKGMVRTFSKRPCGLLIVVPGDHHLYFRFRSLDLDHTFQ